MQSMTTGKRSTKPLEGVKEETERKLREQDGNEKTIQHRTVSRTVTDRG